MSNQNQGTEYDPIALAWTPAASSSSGGSNLPARIFDSNVATFWDSGQGTTTATNLSIDMGVATRVGGIRWYSQFGAGFTPTLGVVEGSNDNVSWTQLAAWTSANANTFNDYGNESWYVSWPWVTYRYIRIRPTAGYVIATGEWVISELRVVPGVDIPAAAVLSNPAVMLALDQFFLKEP